MSDLHFWLYWIASFSIVLSLLSIGVGVTEWWKWRKQA